MYNFQYMTPAQLLEACNIITPPVDLRVIVRFLGIEISLKPDFNKLSVAMESYHAPAQERVKVWLNPFEYPVEQRFSLAYEIGYMMSHYYSDGEVERVRRQEKSLHGGRSSYYDYSAAEFAAELLMPSSMVQVYGQELINFYNRQNLAQMKFAKFSSKMAEIFDVSEKAMETRLSQLGVSRFPL